MRLIHDRAFAMANAILSTVAPCLRPEEQNEAFKAFYRICKEGLEVYELQTNRQEKRLKPGKN
jgi:hypothetical protein